MALMQQGMFGSQNLSPFLQDFINRRGATFGSNIQPVTTSPMSLVASGAEGLFKKLKPVYQDEPGQEDTGPPSDPTTADLIDGYNLLNNPLVSALTPTMFKPFTGIVSLMIENQIEDNLLGNPNKGGLTDPYGNPLTSIPRDKGLFGFEKDFEKAIALSLDPFTALGLKVSPDVAALMPPPVDLPKSEYDETGGGQGEGHDLGSGESIGDVDEETSGDVAGI